VRRGREEAGLRCVGVFRLGLGLLQCRHGLLQLGGAVRHALLEHGLGFDEFALDDLRIGDVGVGRYIPAAGHRLPADLDDLAVDEVALVPVRGAGTDVLDALLDLRFHAGSSEAALLAVEPDQVDDRFPDVDHAGRIVHQLLVAAVPADEPLRRIDDADALRNVLERRVEQAPVESERLRGFIEQQYDVADFRAGFAQCGGHYDTCRRCPDGAGDQALGKQQQAPVCRAR
jgi:hypothetical protein